ncbi:hypothetical protein [[Kitasatospora] papulosa]|uniref:hypothetical protein n=1 Tax=[Kitasatospora] papulosa TaxID=1464011 RepID=UPI0036C6CC46
MSTTSSSPRPPSTASKGFAVTRGREAALTSIGLVLCATGAISLRGEDFAPW